MARIEYEAGGTVVSVPLAPGVDLNGLLDKLAEHEAGSDVWVCFGVPGGTAMMLPAHRIVALYVDENDLHE